MTASLTDRWPLVGRREQLDDCLHTLTADRAPGVVLYGEAGVGKTRLADEVARALEDGGRRVERAVASRTAAELPLGALAHLLPAGSWTGPKPGAGADLDSVTVFAVARRALAAQSAQSAEGTEGADRTVLFVDDLHLLDPASATLIDQLLASGDVALLGTVRIGDPASIPATAFWRDRGLDRVDVATIPRSSVETLLHLALGGPVNGATAVALWNASEGNLLFLYELVLGARADGTLRADDGSWRLTGALRPGARLTEIVGQRLEGLDAPARLVVDLLALCAPVGLAELERLAGLDVVEALERGGLVRVVVDRRRHDVHLGHPLHGEVLRASMPVTRRRTLLRDHIARVEAAGARRREDPLRLASWALELDGTAAPDLLVRAAMIARQSHHFEGVRRLGEAALESHRSPLAALLVGEACFELGDFAASEAVLAGAMAAVEDGDPVSTELLIQLSVTRTKNQFWGLLDPDAAIATAQAVSAASSDPLVAAAMRVDEASATFFSGRPAAAVALLDALEPPADVEERVLRAIVEAPAWSAIGRTGDAITRAETAFADHAALGEQVAIAHPGTHLVNQVFALTDAGRLAEAAELAAAGYEVTVADGALIAQIWFALNLGRIGLLTGHAATARRWHREGAAVARATGFRGPLHLALAGVAAASALLGDAPAATAAVAELDQLPGFGFLAPELAIGRAWQLVATGDHAAARTVLSEGAELAAATGHVVAESWLRHDLLRLGDRATAEPLLALADRADSPLVTARGVHAAAVAAGDSEALGAAAEGFAALGADLVAAEAATAAAEQAKKDGDQRKAAKWADLAAGWASSCEGATTPGLLTTATVVPLSAREREIALLAASGMASKDIAEKLYLSIRTVNNHLQRIYTKVGVSSRTELAAALDRRQEDSP